MTTSPPHLDARVNASGTSAERGQMLALFAMALTALIAMVGLIIDGGSTFVQRRDEQNVADAVAMAGGYASVMGADVEAAGQAIAAANGYVDGVDGTVVTITTSDSSITATVTRPHRNYFAGVVGFSSWDVSATATVQAGIPNGAYGAMPLIFNKKAFTAANSTAGSPVSFGEPDAGTEDVPQSTSQFNWTIFCTANGNPCNANSNGVSQIINGNGTGTTIYLNTDIGPMNAGAHADLYDALAGKVGGSYPVAIVNDEGEVTGWASFHLTGSVGGSTKRISGWFENPIPVDKMVISPTGGEAEYSFGAYVVKLVN